MQLLVSQFEPIKSVQINTHSPILTTHIWTFILPLIKDKLLLNMDQLAEIVERY